MDKKNISTLWLTFKAYFIVFFTFIEHKFRMTK